MRVDAGEQAGAWDRVGSGSSCATSTAPSSPPTRPSPTLIPNPHLLIGPHLRLEAVLSSRIEGTKTDVSQPLRFEAGEVQSADEADDAAEVHNYVVVLEHGLDRIRGGIPVSIRLLREMHEHLLRGVRGQHRLPGGLRSSPVWIGGDTLDDAVFVPPPPEEMARALGDLEQFLHERDLPLLVQLAIAHYQFEVIHPFLDGNGRIGRLLIPLLLVFRDALPEPLLYLSAYFEQHRSEVLRPPVDHQPERRPDAMAVVLPPRSAPTGPGLRRANGSPCRAATRTAKRTAR